MEFPAEILEKAEAAKERLDIHIHYSPHASRQDMAQAEELIRSHQFDIYAPEIPHGTPINNEIWKKIANGDNKLFAWYEDATERRKAGHLALASIAIFYASKVPLIIPDITAQEGVRYGVDDVSSVDLHFKFDSFENDLQRTKEEVHRHAKNIYFRDHIVATRLPAQAMDLIDRTSRLRSRDTVRVLATMGSRHTLLSHLLQERNYNVSRSFNVKPFIFAPVDTAARQVAFGHEVSEKMYMDAFKQFILYLPLGQYMHNHPEDNAAVYAITRRAVDMLSDEQARQLYELLDKGSPQYKELADKLVDAAATK